MTLQKTNSQNTLHPKRWSVQVSLTGLSFLSISQNGVLDHGSKSFSVTTTAEGLSHALTEFWLPHFNSSGQHLQTKVVHQSPYVTVVPLALFKADKAMDYLKFNTRMLQNDVVAYDILEAQEIVVVYIPFVNVNNLVFDTVGPFDFEHSATVLLRHLLSARKSQKESEVFVNIYKDSFDFIVLSSGRLVLFNHYSFHTPDDFIYYILFALEQLSISPEEVHLYLSGQVAQDDDLFQGIYTYVREVNLYTDHELVALDQTKQHESIVLKSTL